MKNWSESVIYQIYPRSFKDSNGDGIGDLMGIIQKLDYFVDLGIDAIWLSPIYPSPMKDFGYDVADYCGVDPIFGDMKDFDVLIKEAHSRDIKIMMDYIPNHTSDQHPWFLESKSSLDNPKRDWYIWKEPKNDGGVPNNWRSLFGGSGWEFDQMSNQYYFHSFLKSQPDLNWRNLEVKKAMYDVLRFWIDKGVDGFRMDAVCHLYKHHGFQDEGKISDDKKDPIRPEFDLDYSLTLNQPEILVWLSEVSTLLNEYDNKFMITECSGRYSDLQLLLDWHESGISHIHSPFNFHLLQMPWDAKKFKEFIDQYDNLLSDEFIPNYVMGNHDSPRLSSRIGKENIRCAALLMLTLRGIPTIYYGEELGMEDVEIPEYEWVDPDKRFINGRFVTRDPERTPMPWTGEENAGFSSHLPWLRINNDYQSVNVQSEKD